MSFCQNESTSEDGAGNAVCAGAERRAPPDSIRHAQRAQGACAAAFSSLATTRRPLQSGDYYSRFFPLTPPKKTNQPQTILHLTDIHFGWDGSDSAKQADRQVCLDGLLQKLKGLEEPWKPTIVCVTGDIGWRGAKSDYLEAKKWFDQLLAVTGLKYDQVLCCAGNHDVARDFAKKIARPEKSDEADHVLESPIAEHWLKPFSEYAAFHGNCGIPAWKFGTENSTLVGERVVNGIRFVALNSAWCAKGDDDQGRLWMGRPHLTMLEANKQLCEVGPAHREPLTVALMHHPLDWLHPGEQHGAVGRPSPWDYLAYRAHLLLTGHTHGGIRGADRIADRALHFTGGSAYQGAAHTNAFRLIRVSADSVEDCSFEFDPRATTEPWKAHAATQRPMYHVSSAAQAGPPPEAAVDTKGIRERCLRDAHRQVELKSRLLRQTGKLPVQVDRPVTLRVSMERDEFDGQGRLVRKKESEATMPLYSAVRAARRTVLLGDLGSGKSTLAARLVAETIEKSEQGVAVFLPAKRLRLAGQFSARDLLQAIDIYIRDNVCLDLPGVSVGGLLEKHIEVLLVFDGLDELTRELAARLLGQAGTLIDNWATIQVVATARPIELAGVSFADWCTLHTVALDDEAKVAFIAQELLADGCAVDRVAGESAALGAALAGVSALNAIAISPLAIRLLYPRLKSLKTDSTLTLGDLVFELLIERLEGWQKRDDKVTGYPELEKHFPTGLRKAELLGLLARHPAAGKKLSEEVALAELEKAFDGISGANKSALAVEALSFFEWLGLIGKGEGIEFPLQPLAEVCAAASLLASTGKSPAFNQASWRTVSFAAAILRRRGQLNENRQSLVDFIGEFLTEAKFIPAACSIVVEAADKALAEQVVAMIDRLEYRPLTINLEDRHASARIVAKAIWLAGDAGFDWFYREYLDPRYPVPNAGCAIVTEVFAEWVALARPGLTPGQKEKLAKLIEPYEATDEGSFHGVLSLLTVVVPEKFPLEQRIWQHTGLLDSPGFGSWAEAQIADYRRVAAHVAIVDTCVRQRAGRGIRAAQLWLEWHPDVDPPYEIVLLALRSHSKRERRTETAAIARECLRRLGEDRWLCCVRWALVAEDPDVIGGAAKVLYERGERRLEVIGEAALASARDGANSKDGETLLAALVTEADANGARWLANQIISTDQWHGAHAVWWRVLLGQVHLLPDGPLLMAVAARNLGPYTLPRYPEVREAFARTLNGPRGEDFRKALRERLQSLDPAIRQGVAAILVSSDPRGEADALFVAIRSRANWRLSDWHEWESFCLTLDFGPSVLESLKGRLGLMERKSRTLALILLQKAKFDLTATETAELEKDLTEHVNWRLAYETVVRGGFATEASYHVQLQQLNGRNFEAVRQAAERLLEFHRAKLTPSLEAKSEALKHFSGGRHWELPAVMQRMARDAGFREEVMTASTTLAPIFGRPPMLGLIASAIESGIGWKDVVWGMFSDGPSMGTSEWEGNGMALLEFALEHPKFRAGIGEAAGECFKDPRMQQNRWAEAYHWLAFFTHEFGSLDSAGLRTAILHGRPIWYAATTALIARLGEVPAGFAREKRKEQPPTRFDKYVALAMAPEEQLKRLMECCRDSEKLHPALFAAMQDALFLPEVDAAALKQIEGVGNTGLVVSTALRFLYGKPVGMAETIPMLDLWARSWVDDSKRNGWGPLFKLWEIVRALSFREDTGEGRVYVTALDEALLAGNIWPLAVAWDLLQVRGTLLDAHIEGVFRTYADHTTYLHETLFRLMARWLATDLTDATKKQAIASAENAILVLNEDRWRGGNEDHPNVWAYLLMPAVQWALAGKSSAEADAVFLRGIRAVFEQIPVNIGQPRANLSKVLGLLDPLFARTPPEVLARVLTQGADSLEPSVAAFCRLVRAFSAFQKAGTN